MMTKANRAIATRETCPDCDSKSLRRRGILTLASGQRVQKYVCKDCDRYFNARTGTPSAGQPTRSNIGTKWRASRKATRTRIGLYLPTELLKDIDQAARDRGMSRTALIEERLSSGHPPRDRDVD